MAPKARRLLLSNLVFEKFSNAQPGYGLAYGLIHGQQYLVLGFLIAEESANVNELIKSNNQNLSLTNELLKCWAAHQTSLPAGVHIIGNICIPGDDQILIEIVEASIPDIIAEDIYTFPTDTQSALSLVFKDGAIQASTMDDYMQKEELEYEILPCSDLLEQFMLIHLKGQVVLNMENDVEAMQEEMQEVISKANLGVFSFYFPGSEVFLKGAEEVSGIDGSKKVDSLIVKDEDSKKKKAKSNSEVVISAELLLKPTKLKDVGELHELAKCAPVVQHRKDQVENLRIPFLVDGLCYVHSECQVKELYKILQDSVTRQLLSVNSSLMNELNETKNTSLPVSMHFISESNGHYLTAVFPRKMDDSALLKKRERMHEAFGLNKDRPVFRKGCRVILKDELPKNALLINPHVGLSPGVKDAEVAVVYGRYAYHHYMQDNFDDNGWGCAYRSLQTLVSWFRLQGYTEKPVPSLKEIQKCLVDIGDKPANFVGSKLWIGSTEVGFCMETLLGVTCRIMNVASAQELCSRGDELVRHFKNQGTPIMIGGGVLAHTILGVAHNPDTEEIRFLILDPHYTQGEDLTLIQTKGWCGWKGPDFWNKTAFYNLCMPQRPACL